jgi:hypothetical protein
MRWVVVALFILLWLIGFLAGAGTFIHLLLLLALLLSTINLIARGGVAKLD